MRKYSKNSFRKLFFDNPFPYSPECKSCITNWFNILAGSTEKKKKISKLRNVTGMSLATAAAPILFEFSVEICYPISEGSIGNHYYCVRQQSVSQVKEIFLKDISQKWFRVIKSNITQQFFQRKPSFGQKRPKRLAGTWQHKGSLSEFGKYCRREISQ